MKREHYYIRTVELVLIFALVLYNIKTWLDHRFAGDGQDILFWAWVELFQDWQLVALQLALPAFFICAGWKTALSCNEIVQARASGGESLLLAGDVSMDGSGSRSKAIPTWRTLLLAKAKEEAILLAWYLGGSLVLFLLHFLGLGTNEQSGGGVWDYVLLTANGHLLYFSVYISFVRLLCLPFVIVAKAWSDESAFLSPQNHTSSESPWQPFLAGAFAITLWSALGWTALLIVPVVGLAYYLHIKGQGRHLWLALHRRYTAVLARGNDEYRWGLMMCTGLLCFMILWANAYFDSLSLNLGLILIFVVPIYFLSVSCASAPSAQTTSLGKTLVNPALLVFVAMISGFLVVMTALPDIRFSPEIRLGPALFSLLLPGSVGVAIAQYFFTLTFHMCLFLLGVYWILVEERIPSVPTTWRNLASVVLTKLILLLWNPIIPSRGTNLYFVGGLSTYSYQVGRFLSSLAGFYFTLWFLTLAKTWCDRPNTSPLDKAVYRNRFGLLFLHPALMHVCGSLVVVLQEWFPALSAPPATMAVIWLAVVGLGCTISSFMPRAWLAAPKYRRLINDDVPSHSLI